MTSVIFNSFYFNAQDAEKKRIHIQIKMFHMKHFIAVKPN